VPIEEIVENEMRRRAGCRPCVVAHLTSTTWRQYEQWTQQSAQRSSVAHVVNAGGAYIAPLNRCVTTRRRAFVCSEFPRHKLYRLRPAQCQSSLSTTTNVCIVARIISHSLSY